MKEIKLNNREYLLVDIEDDDDIIFDGIESRIMSYHKEYKKIGKVSDILKDEDVCKGLVELFSITRLSQFGYKDYLKSIPNAENFTCKTATDSFLSYLQSIDLDLNKEYLLIQKL